jgi:hypothetical protein
MAMVLLGTMDDGTALMTVAHRRITDRTRTDRRADFALLPAASERSLARDGCSS